MRSRRALLLLAGAAALAGGAAPAPAPGVKTVVIKDMAFGPPPTGIKAGDVVEFVNADIFRHTATARDGSFDLDLAPKARLRVRVKAGRTVVYCRYHPDMTVVLAVAP